MWYKNIPKNKANRPKEGAWKISFGRLGPTISEVHFQVTRANQIPLLFLLLSLLLLLLLWSLKQFGLGLKPLQMKEFNITCLRIDCKILMENMSPQYFIQNPSGQIYFRIQNCLAFRKIERCTYHTSCNKNFRIWGPEQHAISKRVSISSAKCKNVHTKWDKWNLWITWC